MGAGPVPACGCRAVAAGMGGNSFAPQHFSQSREYFRLYQPPRVGSRFPKVQVPSGNPHAITDYFILAQS